MVFLYAHVKDRFFTVCQLTCGTRKGLYACVKKTMACLGIAPVECKNKSGCDGTNANIGNAGHFFFMKISHGLWSPGA